MRELISVCVEKGADRLMMVTFKKGDLVLYFFSQWNFLGTLTGSVQLRRELQIPKLPSLKEDISFFLHSNAEIASTIAHLFGVPMDNNGDNYMVYQEDWIDFYRLDVSDNPVGPRIQVLQCERTPNTEKVVESHKG